MKHISFIITLIILLVATPSSSNYSLRKFFDITPDMNIIVGDYINVRSEPSENSKIIHQLRITTLCKVLRTNPREVSINGNKGYWVFIDTGLSEDLNDKNIIRGWVFNYFIAKPDQFIKVSDFHPYYLKCDKGDVSYQYFFYKSGDYRFIINDTYRNETETKIGKLYRYRNVIYAKYKNDTYDALFYIDGNNILCSIYSYKNSEDNCCCKP